MRLSIRAARAWLGPGAVTPDVQVDLDGDRIASVGRVHPVPEDARVVSVEFLMPAAADRHVHIELSDPVAVLRRGVTAVRDLAWPADRIFALAEASELPAFHGPLIRAAGPMLTAPGGYPTGDRWAPPGTGRELNGAEDAASAVRDLHAHGAAAIKVSLNAEAGPTPTDAELAAICDTAQELDLPVTAHAQGSGQVERALGAGIDELAHTPWTERHSEDTIRRAAAQMRWVSTLDIHSYGDDTPELAAALDNLRRFHTEGGEVIYGTDLGNGPIPPGIHARELDLLAEAGLSPGEILTALTRAPIELGAPGDLVALAGDPLVDRSAFDRITMVVRAGLVVAEA